MRQKNIALVTAMATAGITGRTLANQSGINHCTISHLVNRRVVPKPETALAVSKALGRKVTDIFGEVHS